MAVRIEPRKRRAREKLNRVFSRGWVRDGVPLKPYSYQRECIEKLIDAYLSGRRRALFVMATNLGKTFTAAFFFLWYYAFKRELGRKRKPRILVLCHQVDILEQLKADIDFVMGRRFTTGIFHGTQKDFHPVDILFATFQSMEGARREFGKKYFDLILVDEGHHTGALTYARTVRYFTPEIRLAMTATPDRMDGRDIRALWGQEIFSLNLAEAMAQGLLPKVRYLLFLETKKGFRQVLSSSRKLSVQTLNRRFFNAEDSERRDAAIARIVAKHTKRMRDPRTFVFCRDITHCEVMRQAMLRHETTSTTVHSDVPKPVRSARLSEFRAGDRKLVTARDVLNEGIHVGGANVVVFNRTTASMPIWLQQLGRGLHGGDELLVLDFVVNIERMRMLAELYGDIERLKQDWLKLLDDDPSSEPRNGTSVSEREVQEEPEHDVTTNGYIPLEIEAGDYRFDTVVRDLLDVVERLGRRWTPESGAAALRKLAGNSKTLTHRQITAGSKEGKCPGCRWLVNNFAPSTGLLADALTAIGLKSRRQHWTKTAGRTAFRELAGKSKTLAYHQIVTGSMAGECPSIQWLVKHFAPKNGTARDALKAIGLKPARRKWTKKAAIAAFRKLAGKRKTLTHGQIKAATKAGECPSVQWLVKHFAPDTGTQAEALKAIGLKALRKTWTKTAGVSALRKLAGKSKKLTIGEIDEGSKTGKCPSSRWLVTHFAPEGGDTRDALRAIGLEPARIRWTKKTGIAALRKLAGKSKTLTHERINTASKVGDCPSPTWLKGNVHPGTTAQALKMIGLKLSQRSWTKQEGIRAFRKLAGKSKALTQPQIKAGSKAGKCPSHGWLITHLAPKGGSGTDALKAIGLKPGRGGRRN